MYDIAGRDSVWVKPDGNTNFEYVNSGPAKGKTSRITSSAVIQKYGYDSMGRISRLCDSINANEKLAFNYEYDSYGRPSRLTYPTGYSITYQYNSNGYLYQIRDGGTSSVIWECTTTDRWGNITGYSLSDGNIGVLRSYDNNRHLTQIRTNSMGVAKQWFGYSFRSATGNLSWRRDSIRHKTERFRYDLFDRLVSAKGTGIDSLIMAYDDIGNITGKSDVGEYSYHSQKVHAVESIETEEPPLLFSDQRIEYNYMNLPIHIADEEDSLAYTYGTGNNRIKARLFSGGQLVRTTWYGDNFERVVEGSAEKFHHWILSPDGPVALVVTVTGGSTTYYYLCRDHLNSITGIMDASGEMLEEYSYDPWGRRRSPEDWLTTDVTAPGITTRGYTGHEHLDAFGLIHMNGRIYDPHLGRILNPDPIIQEPLNIQNYNRYSYCLNNPLKYTDPSGYKKKKKKDNNECSVVGNTQKDKEVEHSWFYNWLQGTGRGGSSSRSKSGGSGNSGGNEAFTYIPGIYTSFSAPYVSSMSGFGGGSGGTGSLSIGSGGSVQVAAFEVPYSTVSIVQYAEASSDGGLNGNEQIALGYRNYGGDYSGSFSDWAYYIIDQLNQFNPIAISWDYLSFLRNGTDRFGNPMSPLQANLSAAAALIPILKVGKISVAFNGVT